MIIDEHFFYIAVSYAVTFLTLGILTVVTVLRYRRARKDDNR